MQKYKTLESKISKTHLYIRSFQFNGATFAHSSSIVKNHDFFGPITIIHLHLICIFNCRYVRLELGNKRTSEEKKHWKINPTTTLILKTLICETSRNLCITMELKNGMLAWNPKYWIFNLDFLAYDGRILQIRYPQIPFFFFQISLDKKRSILIRSISWPITFTASVKFFITHDIMMLHK